MSYVPAFTSVRPTTQEAETVNANSKRESYLSDYGHCHGDCRAPPAPTARGAQVTELFPYNGKVILGFIFLESEATEGNFKRHLKGSCNDLENWIRELVQSP